MNRETVHPDAWDLVLFVGGLAGLGFALAGASAALALLLINLSAGQAQDTLLTEYLSVAQLIVAAGCLPALYLGARAVFGRPHLPPRGLDRRLWLLVAAFPIGVAAGHLAFQRNLSSPLLSPLAQILTTAAPVVLAVLLVLSNSDAYTPRRFWGQFSGGMLVVPLPATIVEMVGLIVVGTGILLGLLRSPEGWALLSQLAAAGPDSARGLSEAFSRLLQQPIVLALGIPYIVVFVPLVEEAFKTLGVWPWLRRGLSAGEAFAGGAICGAGYGMFEALFLTRPGEGWLAMVIGRSGATLMHAFSAALGSWGLMEGVSRGRWRRALTGYGLAVLLHGLWNAAAIWSGIREVTRGGGDPTGMGLQSDAMHGVILAGLAILSLIALAGLPLMARRLRRPSEGIAPHTARPSNPPAA